MRRSASLTRCTPLIAAIVACVSSSEPTAAQRTVLRTSHHATLVSAPHPVSFAAAGDRRGAPPLVVEWLGGAAGSAAGFGIGLALGGDCGTDDLACLINDAAVAVLLGTVGAAAGTWTAGRLGETGPSGWGATIGSVAGAFAAIGVTHLLSEELNVLDTGDGDVGLVLAYAVTQGFVSAAGSRLFAALR
jgi:hypothetical protein